jgi:hypothetical protein
MAGYVSWSHMSGLLRSIGEDWLVSVLAWLAVDGLMFLGIGGLLATRNATAGSSTRRPSTPTDSNGSSPRTGRMADAGLGLFTTTSRDRAMR